MLAQRYTNIVWYFKCIGDKNIYSENPVDFSHFVKFSIESSQMHFY